MQTLCLRVCRQFVVFFFFSLLAVVRCEYNFHLTRDFLLLLFVCCFYLVFIYVLSGFFMVFCLFQAKDESVRFCFVANFLVSLWKIARFFGGHFSLINFSYLPNKNCCSTDKVQPIGISWLQTSNEFGFTMNSVAMESPLFSVYFFSETFYV